MVNPPTIRLPHPVYTYHQHKPEPAADIFLPPRLGFLFLAIAWTGRSDYNTPPDLGISLGFSGLVFILAGVSLLAVHPAEGIVALGMLCFMYFIPATSLVVSRDLKISCQPRTCIG
jgi:hypothetical protein